MSNYDVLEKEEYIHEQYINYFCEDQGPYSWKILVLRAASSNKILRKFLEM